MKLLILCFWILCIPQSTQSQKVTEPSLEKIVAAKNGDFCKIIEERNFQKLTDFYTHDCWIMLPNERILCGPDAVSDYADYLKKHTQLKSEKLITIDVFGNEKNTLTEVGFYHWLDSNGKAFDDGKYVILWKNEGGVWKRHREIFSSSHQTKN
jgi:ketosteroid isomerase-like protein